MPLGAALEVSRILIMHLGERLLRRIRKSPVKGGAASIRVRAFRNQNLRRVALEGCVLRGVATDDTR